MKPVTGKLSTWWETLRRLSGDDAYERYLEHHRLHHAQDEAPLTREIFYRRETERRWEGVKRCC